MNYHESLWTKCKCLHLCSRCVRLLSLTQSYIGAKGDGGCRLKTMEQHNVLAVTKIIYLQTFPQDNMISCISLIDDHHQLGPLII